MKKLLFSTLSLLFLLSFAVVATAQGNCIQDLETGEWLTADRSGPCPNSVLTAVPFLRIVSDARSGAMGDAGIATSADPNALHFNDSKLVFADKSVGVSATYTPWLRALGLNDVYLAYLTGYTQLDEFQTIGVGLRYFSLGDIAFTDDNGQPLGNGRPNEFEVKASYARKLSDKFAAGIGAKYIFSNLASGQTVNGQEISAGTAFAADISFTYRTDMQLGSTESEFTAGLALSNIGSKITYTNAASNARDFIPANFGLGAGLNMKINDYNTFAIVGEINKLMVPTPCLGNPSDPDYECDNGSNGGTADNDIPDWKEQSSISGIFSSFGDAQGGFSEELREITYSFGMEYWYDQQFALRAGYYGEHDTKGARNYATVGLGLKYNIFGLNFSYLVPLSNQRSPLDNTLRFSLLFDFGAFDSTQG